MTPELPESLEVALRVIDALEDVGVAYHVGGSYASSIHGVPRQTQDIDLVVDLTLADVEELISRLEDSFYLDEDSLRQAVQRKASCNLVHLGSGIKVDLFVRGDDPFDREESARSRPQVVRAEPERAVQVKTAEDTLLRKLQWYRMGGEVSDRQWSDVLGIVRTQAGNLDLEHLRRWARHLGVEDLLDQVLA